MGGTAAIGAPVVKESLTAQAQAKKAHVWQRDALDWYVEPAAVTTALLAVERFVGTVWDPCCGQGNIVTALRDGGVNAFGTDIEQRHDGGQWWAGQYDFLAAGDPLVTRAPNIVMNPPFFRGKGAEAFIRRALDIATGKVACFVDIRFLAGGARANGLWKDRPPHRIWIITPRVSCPPGEYLAAGNKAGGGSSDWCWLVWDLTAPPATHSETRWLRWRAV